VGTVSASIEALKGWDVGRGCPSPHRGRGLGGGCPLQKKISILDLKQANFGANWVLFAQFHLKLFYM